MTPPAAGRRRNSLGSWRIRRAFMLAVAALCAWVIVYCLVNRLDTRVAETAVMAAFLTLGTIVGAYVFGAAWEDISFDRHRFEYGGATAGDDYSGNQRPV